MATTVRDEIDNGNPEVLPGAMQMAGAGRILDLAPRSEVVAVVGDHATLSKPARQVLRCFASAAGSPGEKTTAVAEATPPAGNCAVDPAGGVEFAAADTVTEAEVTFVPIEDVDIVDETIPVTAGGVGGPLLQSRRGWLLVAATLNAPAVAPGAKTVMARGTASAAGQAALTDAGTGVTFNVADCGSATTATVSYAAFPGVGTGAELEAGARLDHDYPL
jgi:hypothetical protein